MTLLCEFERLNDPQHPQMQKTAERFAASPHARAQLETQKKLWVAAMLEQSYDCAYATLIVRRDRSEVTAKWQYKECVKDTSRWVATAGIREIEYVPDANAPAPRAFYQKKGNGEMRWTVPEGHCYSGIIVFHDIEAYRNNEDDLFAPIYFNFSVPLSYSKSLALTRAIGNEKKPETGIPQKVVEFMQKRDEYDAVMRESIGLIKAKGLSPEDEEQEIADLQDYGSWLKEKEDK